MSQQSDKNQQPGFWNWGKGLAVVITLFVVTTLSVVFYLVSLDYYMVSENHYEKAVNYQQQIDRMEHARALEQSVSVQQLQSSDLRIQFPDTLTSSRPEGTIRLYRPSDSNLDRSYKLNIDSTGKQLLPGADLKKGKWLVQITWQSGGREYFQEISLFL